MTGNADSAQVGGHLSNAQISYIWTAIAVGVFVVDVASLPLGVAAGIAYVPAVLVALLYPRWQHTFAVAGVTSFLTVTGFLMSEQAAAFWMVIANRLLALSAIWLTAIGGRWVILIRRRKADEELRLAQLDADKARAAKLRFLLTASNDIRHHLQTLVLLNAAMRKTVSDPKALEMLAGQGDAMGHLSDLMNSLLDVTDMETGEVEPRIEEFRLNDILQVLDEDFRSSAEAKGLGFSIDASTAVVRSDRKLLTQALRRLLANAIRYTEKGEVAVRCIGKPKGLRITVRDTGIGIEDVHLENIFDEFYRVENNPAGRDVGLGLGLTIVDRISRLLDIKLKVKSKPGSGSKFSLLVPVASEAS
jgi:signal transduction histidine kinase